MAKGSPFDPKGSLSRQETSGPPARLVNGSSRGPLHSEQYNFFGEGFARCRGFLSIAPAGRLCLPEFFTAWLGNYRGNSKQGF